MQPITNQEVRYQVMEGSTFSFLNRHHSPISNRRPPPSNSNPFTSDPGLARLSTHQKRAERERMNASTIAAGLHMIQLSELGLVSFSCIEMERSFNEKAFDHMKCAPRWVPKASFKFNCHMQYIVCLPTPYPPPSCAIMSEARSTCPRFQYYLLAFVGCTTSKERLRYAYNDQA